MYEGADYSNKSLKYTECLIVRRSTAVGARVDRIIIKKGGKAKKGGGPKENIEKGEEPKRKGNKECKRREQ